MLSASVELKFDSTCYHLNNTFPGSFFAQQFYLFFGKNVHDSWLILLFTLPNGTRTRIIFMRLYSGNVMAYECKIEFFYAKKCTLTDTIRHSNTSLRWTCTEIYGTNYVMRLLNHFILNTAWNCDDRIHIDCYANSIYWHNLIWCDGSNWCVQSSKVANFKLVIYNRSMKDIH